MSSTIESQRTSDYTYYLLKRMTLLYYIYSKLIANDRRWYERLTKRSLYVCLITLIVFSSITNRLDRKIAVNGRQKQKWKANKKASQHTPSDKCHCSDGLAKKNAKSTISMIKLCICIFSLHLIQTLSLPLCSSYIFWYLSLSFYLFTTSTWSLFTYAIKYRKRFVSMCMMWCDAIRWFIKCWLGNVVLTECWEWKDSSQGIHKYV